MISPRSSLLWLTALVFVPAATVWAAIPAQADVAALILLGFPLLAAIDAALLRPEFSAIDIVMPEIVRLSKGREASILVSVAATPSSPAVRARRGRRVHIGFSFPSEIGAAQSEFDVDLAAVDGKPRARLSITCEPQQRGRFFLKEVYLQAATRLGLWNVRRRLPVQSELRVYPDLLSERRNIAALFLRRGLFGFRQYRQVGKGREFEKLREYIAGDAMEDVHWKATAKRGHPVTKVFQIEKTQEVYVLVDCSRLSGRWSAGMPLLERFINSALVLCLAAAKQGDLFGLISFSDKVQTFVGARNGKAHYDRCRDALYTLQPQTVSPDFADLFALLRLRLRRRALLVFFTALDDPALAESFVQHVDLLTRQHLVLINMIQPPEAAPLFADPNVTELDDVYRRLGGHLLWGELQELGKRLQRLGAEFSLLGEEKLAAEAVTRYLQVKQRQAL
jgi:uncharacterized protein (DUF58 family)